MLFLAEGVTETGSIAEFVSAIISAVTSNISLATVASVVASIIAAGIVAIFAWKFARKGFGFIKNALSGRSGKF